MLTAITTKYLGATNNRGSRIKASTAIDGQTVTIPYPYDMSQGEAHRFAAEAVAAKMGWGTDYYGPLVGGATKDGYVFVFRGV